jgi:hypothetical protein
VTEPEEFVAGWQCEEEKLLVLIELNDDVALILSRHAGVAFFRAFIVQNRATDQIRMRFRFRYVDRDAWYIIVPEDQQDAVRKLRENIADVLLMAGDMIEKPVLPLDIRAHEPPDDGGDFQNTIDWLVDRDLMTITKVAAVEAI